MKKPKHIRVIAICVFRNKDKILVFEAFDSVKNTPFYRPLGGAVELGETSEEAVIREIREETGQEIIDLHLLGVLESIFELEGEPGHEIVFVYEGRFADTSIYTNHQIEVVEDNGERLTAVWRQIGSFNDHERLVPEDLLTLLQDNAQ